MKFKDLINEYVATVGHGPNGIAGKVKSIVHLGDSVYQIEFSELLAELKPVGLNIANVSESYLERLTVIDAGTFAEIEADMKLDEQVIQ